MGKWIESSHTASLSCGLECYLSNVLRESGCIPSWDDSLDTSIAMVDMDCDHGTFCNCLIQKWPLKSLNKNGSWKKGTWTVAFGAVLVPRIWSSFETGHRCWCRFFPGLTFWSSPKVVGCGRAWWVLMVYCTASSSSTFFLVFMGVAHTATGKV